jgi:hypothetical protein
MRVVDPDVYGSEPRRRASGVDLLFRAKLARDLQARFGLPTEPVPPRFADLVGLSSALGRRVRRAALLKTAGYRSAREPLDSGFGLHIF